MTRLDARRFRHPRTVLLLAVLSSAAALADGTRAGAPASAHPTSLARETGPAAEISATQEVTALDVLVESPGRVPSPPAKLAEGVEAFLDDAPTPLVATETAAEMRPWRVVLYFGATLSSPLVTAWAANLLATAADELVGLGSVEVVVADPDPVIVLAATTDAQALGDALSGLFFTRPGHDAVLTRREDLWLGAEGAISAASIEAAEAAEQQLVQRAQGDLLDWIVGDDSATERRLLLLVGMRHDEQPAGFYEALPEVEDAPSSIPVRLWSSEEMARTAAAYGWVVAGLSPRLRGETRALYGEASLHGLLVGSRTINGWLSGNLKPKKAAALHELGLARERQGDLEGALAALGEALHYYHGQRKTADRQAAVLVAAGRVERALGREVEARQSLRQAVALDPALAAEQPFTRAVLLDGEVAPRLLAEHTAGSVVRQAADLSELLDSLRRRVRLTVQRSGPPDGRLHGLTLRQADGTSLRAPSTVRSGPPEVVSALRLLRLLESTPETAAHGLEVAMARQGSEAVVELHLGADALPRGSRETLQLRITLAVEARGEKLPRLLQRTSATAVADSLGDWRPRYVLTAPSPGDRVAVVVEDLGSASWIGALAGPSAGAEGRR